jgi:hypothetical protein
MARGILIVVRKLDLEETIRDLVSEWGEKKGYDLDFNVERCLDDGWKKLSKADALELTLVITELDIPEARKQSVNKQAHLGLTLLKKAQDKGIRVPSLVLTDNKTPELELECQKVMDCELVWWGGVTGPELLSRAIDDADSRAEQASQMPDEVQMATIDIDLKSDPPRYEMFVPDRATRQGGNLNIDHEALQDAKDLTGVAEGITRKKDLHTVLKQVGKKICKQLFNNTEFVQDFGGVINAVKSLANVRIHFHVDEESYDIALESLYNDDYHWWRLEAPITRRIPGIGRALPLFQGQERSPQPINCLLIEADASGYIEGFGSLKHLSNVKRECDELEALLSGRGACRLKVPIGDVVRIPDPERGLDGAPSFKKRLEDVLTAHRDGAHPFHIVHFAGHSLYNPRKKRAYLVLPGQDGMGGEPLTVERFATLVQDPHTRDVQTRFVFLSSCHSSEEVVMTKMARRDIPAILGFRWDIDDGKAAEYTLVFYKELLCKSEHPSLERAFLRAVLELHEEDEMDRTWAAPIMVLQSD